MNEWLGYSDIFCTYTLWLHWTRITFRVHGVLELYRFLYFQEVTIVVYLRVWKSHVLHIQGSIKYPSSKMCIFKGCFVSRTLDLDECAAQKRGFSCFQTVTDRLLLKLLGYPEHFVYSERLCYCSNLYRPNKWYAYARNCIGPCYSRQNLYIQKYFLAKNVYSRLRVWLSCLHTEPKFSPSAPHPIGG